MQKKFLQQKYIKILLNNKFGSKCSRTVRCACNQHKRPTTIPNKESQQSCLVRSCMKSTRARILARSHFSLIKAKYYRFGANRQHPNSPCHHLRGQSTQILMLRGHSSFKASFTLRQAKLKWPWHTLHKQDATGLLHGRINLFWIYHLLPTQDCTRWR